MWMMQWGSANLEVSNGHEHDDEDLNTPPIAIS